MPRFEHIDGIGRFRVYDHGPNAGHMDRYLVLFEDMASVDPRTYDSIDKPRPYGLRQSLAMSSSPDSPQGVSIWDYSYPPETWGGKSPRWRRIPFTDLPENIQRHVLDRARD